MKRVEFHHMMYVEKSNLDSYTYTSFVDICERLLVCLQIRGEEKLFMRVPP